MRHFFLFWGCEISNLSAQWDFQTHFGYKTQKAKKKKKIVSWLQKKVLGHFLQHSFIDMLDLRHFTPLQQNYEINIKEWIVSSMTTKNKGSAMVAKHELDS